MAARGFRPQRPLGHASPADMARRTMLQGVVISRQSLTLPSAHRLRRVSADHLFIHLHTPTGTGGQ